jgi:hypothetical protein
MSMHTLLGRTRPLLVLLWLLAIVPLAGCRSVGELASQDFESAFGEEIEAGDLLQLADKQLEDFDALDIGASFAVEVVAGDRFEVIVRASENVVDDVVVEVRGSTLHLGVDSSGLFEMVRDVELEAVITMPELVEVDLSGASSLRFTGFESGRDFRADVSGASSLDGALSAGDTAVDASGASSVTLVGEGGNLRVDASGSSSVDLAGYVVQDAEIDASGASNVELDARGDLEADASGAADIRYAGEPTLGSIRTSGAGSVGER